MRKLFLTVVATAILAGVSSSVAAAPSGTPVTEPVRPSAPVTWLTSFSQAQEIARKEKKALFILFTGSDWCPWCVRLHDEVLTRPEFQEYARKKLVLVLVDFPRKKGQTPEQKKANQALAQKYEVQGFPTVLLTDANGSIIGTTGYQRGGAASYVKHLETLLKP